MEWVNCHDVILNSKNRVFISILSQFTHTKNTRTCMLIKKPFKGKEVYFLRRIPLNGEIWVKFSFVSCLLRFSNFTLYVYKLSTEILRASSKLATAL